MVGKWLGKNSTNWLNTSASSGSQSLGCMWTLLTDARVVELAFLWAAGGPRPQCLFVHLLPVCPAFSILNSRSFQSRLTSVFWWTWLWRRPPGCLWCWVWMVSVFGAVASYCLQPSLSTGGLHSCSPGTGRENCFALGHISLAWTFLFVLSHPHVSYSPSFGDSSRPEL